MNQVQSRVVKREYNIHDGTTSVRPMTRSNQRRPVSRQVDTNSAQQKIMIQQQMRNTHFGGEGFSKFKPTGNTAALVAAATSGAVFEQIDSDRNRASRKRGAKTTNNRNEELRDSQTKIPATHQQPLNRSITLNKNGSGD